MEKMNSNRQKTFKCECCGQELPENRKYFVWYKEKQNNSWHKPICRECEAKLLVQENKRINNGVILYKCKICGEWLPKEEFNEVHQSVNGAKYEYRDHLETRCRSCKLQQIKNQRQSYSDERTFERMINARWLNAKERATRKNIPFDITKEDLTRLWKCQEGKCAISGIDMTHEVDKGRVFTNISVDQINPSEGYTTNNIQLVCMGVNQMKSDMSMNELYMFCEAILNNKENVNIHKEKE